MIEREYDIGLEATEVLMAKIVGKATTEVIEVIRMTTFRFEDPND